MVRRDLCGLDIGCFDVLGLHNFLNDPIDSDRSLAAITSKQGDDVKTYSSHPFSLPSLFRASPVHRHWSDESRSPVKLGSDYEMKV